MISIPFHGNPRINVFAKLECYNPTGSIKDRAAFYIINYLLDKRIITKNTTIIESSSGNFGVSLSAYTRLYGLKFICVVDKTTLPINEQIIKLNGAKVIRIDTPDKFGGYLLNRIAKVKEIVTNTDDIYWINQYENVINAQGYYHTLGEEICDEAPNHKLDYIFMGVSSGGTITGISRKVKERYPNAQVIAVDVEGSVIFDGKPKKRFIPGIGSSIKPRILQYAKIDQVVTIDEEETVAACRKLFKNHNIMVGGSSGSVYAAVHKYFHNSHHSNEDLNIMCVFADTGSKYLNTLYNKDWCKMVKEYNNRLQLVPNGVGM